jgi:antitoxin (DNA-binding transcriptional repressor) of toxin-antitoxin stability system
VYTLITVYSVVMNTSDVITQKDGRERFGDLVIRAMNGRTTVITRYGRPVAQIGPIAEIPILETVQALASMLAASVDSYSLAKIDWKARYLPDPEGEDPKPVSVDRVREALNDLTADLRAFAADSTHVLSDRTRRCLAARDLELWKNWGIYATPLGGDLRVAAHQFEHVLITAGI